VLNKIRKHTCCEDNPGEMQSVITKTQCSKRSVKINGHKSRLV
jgi:hypothetical protein